MKFAFVWVLMLKTKEAGISSSIFKIYMSICCIDISFYLSIIDTFSKLLQNYEKSLRVSSSVKEKFLSIPPSGREWAT